jgi:hypothetical protein
MTPVTTILATRIAVAAAAVLGGLILPASEAGAVSARVRMACAGDYFSYCSQYSPGGSEVRQCMRANGLKLSKSCVAALVADGEVSKAEVARRAAAAN